MSIFFTYMVPFPDSSIIPTLVFSEVAMNQGICDSMKAQVLCISVGDGEITVGPLVPLPSPYLQGIPISIDRLALQHWVQQG